MIKKSLEAYFFTLKNKIVFCKKQFQNMSVFCFVSGKDNIKCERKRKPPDALFFYLKSTEREVRTCETTDI